MKDLEKNITEDRQTLADLSHRLSDTSTIAASEEQTFRLRYSAMLFCGILIGASLTLCLSLIYPI